MFEIQHQKQDKGKLQEGEESILLVEDEDAILKMAQMMLERLGYNVLAASTPGQAIEISNKGEKDIQLLMTDVILPTMNGRDLAKKNLKMYPNIKCLYMSGYTANVIEHQGLLDEGLDFINKPFSKYDLSLKLREILDGTYE